MPNDRPKEWPQIITPEVLAFHSHVPDAEIAQDIADTEAEIEQLEAVLKAERIIADNSLDEQTRRMSDFKAGARPYQISERRKFVDFLKRLQTARRGGSPDMDFPRPMGATPQ